MPTLKTIREYMRRRTVAKAHQAVTSNLHFGIETVKGQLRSPAATTVQPRGTVPPPSPLFSTPLTATSNAHRFR